MRLLDLGYWEIYQGKRDGTIQSLKFMVSLGSVRQCLIDPSNMTWLDDEVREHHSWQSFEHPDRIADAIRLILGYKYLGYSGYLTLSLMLII